MKKFILYSSVILLFCLFNNKAIATNLRGRVLYYNPNVNSYFPASGTRVDIWVFNGIQWLDVSYAVTGADGMYYFMNFAPGVNFRIQVNGNFYPAQPLFLTNVPLFDIPQIII